MTPAQLAKSGSEHAHQRALFAWANMAANFNFVIADIDAAYVQKSYAQYLFDLSKDRTEPMFKPIPELEWLHAIHNQGHGDAIRGSKAKAEGVKAGVWDIFLPVTIFYEQDSLKFAGLYIEMKVGKNTLTTEQSEFGHYAIGQGYKTAICWSWQDARDAILKYLGLME